MIDRTIENQQERLFHIGYLLGMLDGEGAVQFNCKHISKGRRYYTPKISVSNNNPLIIQQTIDSLKYLEIPFHVWTPKRTYGHEARVMYRITIAGIKRCQRFIDIVWEHSFGKKERVGVIKEYISQREKIPPTQKQSGHEISYGEKEYYLVEKLKNLNLEYNGTVSSETTRFRV